MFTWLGTIDRHFVNIYPCEKLAISKLETSGNLSTKIPYKMLRLHKFPDNTCCNCLYNMCLIEANVIVCDGKKI